MPDHTSKIKSLARLLPIAKKLKSEGKKIVLAHGVFDLLHYGHIHQLKQAKRMGDALVVSMKTDKFVHKASGRPIFNTRIRAACLEALRYVDYVLLCEEEGPYKIIKKLKPDVYIKGAEYLDQLKDPTNPINKDRRLVEASGGIMRFSKMVRFTRSTPIHSTNLIRKNINIFLGSYRIRKKRRNR